MNSNLQDTMKAVITTMLAKNASDNSKVKKYCCISVMICMIFLKQNLLALGETLAYHDKNLAILSLVYEYMYILNTCECVYVCIHNLGIVIIGRVS